MKTPLHPYHIVDSSPWPLISAFSSFTTVIGGALYMNGFALGGYTLSFGLFLLFFSMFVWWRDVVRESTFEGFHTKKVQQGLRLGMVLFIASEVMFFFGFFWAFFHSSLSPAIEIGAIWPPVEIIVFNCWGIPLLNTIILLLSGAAVTWAHHEIIAGRKTSAQYGLLMTICLAVVFTGFQGLEYVEASFSISDGIYGSTFYMATGFHGFHVVIGTLFLIVCFFRLGKNHFTRTHHFGFEAACWYWHFVDVVWLILFVVIYWWGNSL